MTWATIAGLLVQYSFPTVDKIVTGWLTNPNAAPNADEWNSLKARAAQNAKSQMLAALSRAGIDPASPQGLALMAQAPS